MTFEDNLKIRYISNTLDESFKFFIENIYLLSPENLNNDSREKSLEVRRRNALMNEHNRKATTLIIAMRKENKSFSNIALELNQSGFKTRRNKFFSAMTVKRLFDRTFEYSENFVLKQKNRYI